MINLERILTADPKELANMMCYLAYDCENCPVYRCGKRDPSLSECKRNLYSWIMSAEDKDFWRYLNE